MRSSRWAVSLKALQVHGIADNTFVVYPSDVAEANAEVVAQLRETAAKYEADLKANKRPLWRAGN